MAAKILSRVRFHDDTLREVAVWAARKYRMGRLEIIWRSKIVDGSGKAMRRSNGKLSRGCATVFSNGSQHIELSIANTYRKSIEVLAHELAHIVILRRRGYAGHGPIFRRNLSRLVADWNSYMKGREEYDDA